MYWALNKQTATSYASFQLHIHEIIRCVACMNITVFNQGLVNNNWVLLQIMGKFGWGFRYVIIFLYVQFWIRLGSVSYHGKKVRTVDSPAARSVNKSNTPQLQSSWRCQYEVTVHHRMSPLSTAGAMVTTHENSVMMWSFKGTKLFSVL